MEQNIAEFMNRWNLHRWPLGMTALRADRGYKYTRLIDTGSHKTEAFIDNVTGDIYKAASNVARAQTIRGHIDNAEIFESGSLLGTGVMQHFKRGRKPNAVLVIDIETHELAGDTITVAAPDQLETSS